MAFQKEKFLSQWNKEDELCPQCSNILKPAKGLNRQNIKRLFSLKGNPKMILVYLLMALFIFSYIRDTSVARNFVSQMDNETFMANICSAYFDIERGSDGGLIIGNITGKNITVDNYAYHPIGK